MSDSVPVRANGQCSTVTVIVVTCGDTSVTSRCVASVAQSRHDGLQLVVINNGAGSEMQATLDACASQANGQITEMHVITNDCNIGACASRNQGLAVADGDVIAFIDNDIACHDQQWLVNGATFLASDGTIGAIGPRLVRWQPRGVLECAGYAITRSGEAVALGADACVGASCWLQRRRVQCVGNFLARTSVVREIGGFDTAFDPFGFENTDCCYRIKQLGLDVYCDGLSDLWHIGHVTTGTFDRGGRQVLFEKSLLLRRRWSDVFAQEEAMCDELLAIGRPNTDGSSA